MSVTTLLRSLLAAVLMASATACGASSAPDVPVGTPAGPGGTETPRSADPEPVAAVMPDVIGGNAGRAHEQMGSGTDVTFRDASGRGRSVDDPAEWRICGSRPGPNRQITDYPVVLDVVRVSEDCADVVPR
ncbi:hypothetical protein [Streptomyces sp. Tu 3180]|uniref:hypothetical protein n=1 Tax=Streptomyces sp. Tu 3180 TaxID=2682611 RepID=UPI00135A1853|nr:hypothetical protein [Streptomyces sp. Tu 3180]KAF3467039.1 hypothetical protein GL259_23855 [Streptomyces sp. Tu 3180]